MKAKILSFTAVLVLSLSIMLAGFSCLKAEVPAYVNKSYLVWDGNYLPDRNSTGHYIVKLNDPSSYLNVRDEPSLNGNIIGFLINNPRYSL